MISKYLVLFSIIVLPVLSSSTVGSNPFAPHSVLDDLTQEDLAHYFDAFDQATIIISDGAHTIAYNEAFCTQRQSPCSTFKIPNALIALEEGVVFIKNSTKEWDGTVYARAELNENHDLASAMKHSCLWYYKQLATSIGPEAMQNYMNEIGYGNMDISGGIDTFWLNSSLEISPQEQLDFIIKLYDNELPFSIEHMDYVKSILYQEGYQIELYGKTGSSGFGDGWFVGYSEFAATPVFFAAYVEHEGINGPAVRDITAQLLQQLLGENE